LSELLKRFEQSGLGPNQPVLLTMSKTAGGDTIDALAKEI
jgi:hypothetical protein